MRIPYPNELYHYGILGQKWGVRRYQNPDGSLTDAGLKRYRTSSGTFNYNKAERDHVRGKLDANKLAQNTASKMSDEQLQDMGYKAANGILQTKGNEKRALIRISQAIYSETADRSSFKDDDGSTVTKSKGKTDLSSESWEKSPERIKQLKAADEKMRYSAKTDEEKDRRVHKWEDARDHDKFDINFLESIQNSKIFIDGDKQAMVIEYAYYLSDPAGYMRYRKHDEY